MSTYHLESLELAARAATEHDNNPELTWALRGIYDVISGGSYDDFDLDDPLKEAYRRGFDAACDVRNIGERVQAAGYTLKAAPMIHTGKRFVLNADGVAVYLGHAYAIGMWVAAIEVGANLLQASIAGDATL